MLGKLDEVVGQLRVEPSQLTFYITGKPWWLGCCEPQQGCLHARPFEELGALGGVWEQPGEAGGDLCKVVPSGLQLAGWVRRIWE